MNNDLLMYIEGYIDIKEGIENQINYDSRSKKKKVKHRLDDVFSLLSYKKNVLVNLKYQNELLEGVVEYIKENKLKLYGVSELLNIEEIDEVNILRFDAKSSDFLYF